MGGTGIPGVGGTGIPIPVVPMPIPGIIVAIIGGTSEGEFGGI